jgi:hypothetical protein
MIFKDNEFKFSFEIPSGWNNESLGFFKKLLVPSLRASISPIEGLANMNFTCTPIEGELIDVGIRDHAILQYLSSNNFSIIRSGSISDELGGEKNTTTLEYKSPSNRPENLMRKISSVHNGTEYVITFLGNPKIHNEAYKKVRDSFTFY